MDDKTIALVNKESYEEVVARLGYKPFNLKESKFMYNNRAIVAQLTKYNPRKVVTIDKLIQMYKEQR